MERFSGEYMLRESDGKKLSGKQGARGEGD